MVTPLHPDGSVDLEGVGLLATHLVDSGNDGLVVNGTTGESPTTSDAEKDAVVRATVEAVGNRAHVVAGVGTFDTAHTVELAASAQKAGAAGLLVVSPYYSRPPQAGLLHHFTTVADASDLPVMLYDIPVRTGVPIETETMLRLAEHVRIVAVKDAKDDFAASGEVIERTDLAYYAGSDPLLLPVLSIGGVGVVGVVNHIASPRIRQLIEAYDAGDTAGALLIHQALRPLFAGLYRTQGVILTKAALNLLGLPGGPVRSPLLDASPEQLATLREDLALGGVVVNA